MKTLTAEKVKTSGDIPTPRFGHTFTMVSPNKAVMFGGAVSLNNKFVITNETYVYDFTTSRWTKLNFKHDFVPTERAAHAAVAVAENQLIIYGGAASGNQGLLKDQLYILDLRKQPVWKIIEVANKTNTPGQRYGHTMLFSKPHLVVFGGNSGNKAQNDVWLLNILRGPFTWHKYQFQNKIAPSPRVYHSAAICEEGSAYGMMVVYGGRKQTKKDHQGSMKELQVAALNDVWGLRKHRDGSWDWVTPPKSQTYTPICRYQHLCCFIGSSMVIMGGRSNNPDEAVSQIQVYDTEKSQWTRYNSMSRYRHAVALFDKTQLYVHGGFEPTMAAQPLDSLLSINLASILAPNAITNNWSEPPPQENREVLAPQNTNITNVSPLTALNTLKQPPLNKNMMKMRRELGSQNMKEQPRSSRVRSTVGNFNKTAKQRDLTPSRIINTTKNIRLSNQAVVAIGDNCSMMQIQRVPVNSLLEESKKLTSPQQQLTLDLSSLELAESVIQTLVGTNQVKPLNSSLFPFKKDKVIRLCQEASKIVMKESSLLGVRSPVKIFGSVYGRFYDLLKVFEEFGFPDEHEMESNEYVFLGNYVDKGFNSLQTVCLLLSLKIKYPDHVILLRGKHQDSTINRICGLGEECSIRLGENINEISSAFSQVNNFFDCLPLAVAIEDKYLCVNSGIGSIDNLTQIKEVTRPVKVRNSPIVMDLLWSGTPNQKNLNYESQSCSDEEIQQFLEANCLQNLINTRDSMSQSVEEEGHTLSVCSVSSSSQSSVKGGLLKINKNLSLVPYLLSSASRKGGWVTDLQMKSNLPFTSDQTEARVQLLEL